jgi:hypothetical protein
MKQIGSAGHVNVVAQFDRMSDHHTRRFHISRGGALSRDMVGDLGETNTGDPRVLRDFIAWAVTNYPARRYALVLWNHGSGWKEDNIYQLGRSLKLGKDELTARQARRFAQNRANRAFFSSTVGKLLQQPPAARGILFDDSSRDFLDNAELAGVLAFAAGVIGKKVDLLGMDACLMSMLEVAYQCRRSVDVFVGSEETEPAAGWPYQRVLGRLVAQAEMLPRDLGSAIVNEYVASYGSGQVAEVVTQSAMDLTRVEPAATALDGLSVALMNGLADPRVVSGMRQARKEAQSFYDRDYLDLLNLATLFQKYCPSKPVYDAAQRLIEVISPGVEGSLVIASRSQGRETAESHGVSIYFPPEGRVSSFYNELEISQTTRWNDFLEAYRSRA